MQGTEPSFGSRLAGIDGIRAVAAGSVLLYHVWLYGPHGQLDMGWVGHHVLVYLPVGLSLFFVLAGFLLSRPFAAAVLRCQSRPRVRAYLRNRALRIVPAYWVILLVVVFVLESAIVRTGRTHVTNGTITDPLTLLENLALLQNYRPTTVSTGIGPAWSLAVEVVFYVSLPLLALMAGLLARRAPTDRGRLAGVLAPAAVLVAV